MRRHLATLLKLVLCFLFVAPIALFCACDKPETKTKDGLVYSFIKNQATISLEKGNEVENLVIDCSAPEVVLKNFSGQENLKTLTINLPNAKKVTFSKKSFQNCPNLQELTLTVGENCKVMIKKKAFWSCNALKTATFNGGTVDMANQSFSSPNIETVTANNATLAWITPMLQYTKNVKDITINNGFVYFYFTGDIFNREKLNVTIENISVSNNSSCIFDYESDKPIVKNIYFAEDFAFANGKISSLRYAGFLYWGNYQQPIAENIYLNKTCGNIPAKFFGEKGSATLYFNGTAEEWNALTIAEKKNETYFFDNITVVTQNP